jgi:hypothetical protein
MGPSRWARERFGDAAEGLVAAVPGAILLAHEYAVSAQLSGHTQKKDPYGHTLKNTQHECLVDACRGLPGASVIHPKGASFDLVAFRDASVVLYPWRYADAANSRQKARMRTSGFRQELLASDAPSRQLTIDQHAHLTQEELEQQFEQETEMLEQMRSLARVVTVGYASNDSAFLELGWGDAELVDDRGTVAWRNWEDLPLLGHAGGGGGALDLAVGGTPPVRPPGTSGPAAQRPPRFDDVPPLDDDDFGLRPRDPQDED